MRKHSGILFIISILSQLTGVWSSGSSTQNSKENLSLYALPYPQRSIYVEHGITGSVGFGYSKVEGQFYHNSSLFQWQGEGSFYYTPYLSGGASAKIIAGEATDSSTQVENRYVIFARLHKRISRIAFYTGPFIGLYNLDFSRESPEVTSDTTADAGDVETALLDFGWDFGLGWSLIRPWGITLGIQLEQITDGELFIKNFTDEGFFFDESLIRIQPGITLEFTYFWEELAKLSKGVFLAFEFQYCIVEDRAYPRRNEETAFMLGISVAF